MQHKIEVLQSRDLGWSYRISLGYHRISPHINDNLNSSFWVETNMFSLPSHERPPQRGAIALFEHVGNTCPLSIEDRHVWGSHFETINSRSLLFFFQTQDTNVPSTCSKRGTIATADKTAFPSPSGIVLHFTWMPGRSLCFGGVFLLPFHKRNYLIDG